MIPNTQKIGYFYIKYGELKELPLNVRDFCTSISDEEYDEELRTVIPAWFESKENYDKLIHKEYQNIMPMTAEVIPSLTCPYRCEQCSYRPQKEQLGLWNHQTSKNKHTEMTKETMDIVINRLIQAGTKYIVFTGGGEPLCNAEVTLHGMNLAQKNDMCICLYTNGFMINSSIASELMTINPYACRISIYGFDEIGYSKYTNTEKCGYEKVFKNIRTLVDKHEELNSKTAISLSFLLHPQMFEHIEDIESFNILDMLIKHLGSDYLKRISTVRFTPAIDYYGGEQTNQQFFGKIFEQVEKSRQKGLTEYGVQLKPYYHRIEDLYSKKPYSKCYACGLYAEIGPDGNMYQCCERLLMEEYSIGNLKRNSIKDIYSSQNRANVLRNVNNKILDCPPVCKPHEANKQFSEVFEGAEKSIGLYDLWFDLLKVIARDNGDFGEYNPFES